jgi:peptidyl-prolyl cis-trans isomerase SurA
MQLLTKAVNMAGFMGKMNKWVAGVTAGVLLALSGAAYAQPVNPFATAVTVNGGIVTNYQIEQRLAFATLLRSPDSTRQSITDQLVDEVLQAQAARAAGIGVTPEELDAGMVEFAARTNLEPEQFIAALGAGGVEPETFRDFIRSGLLWRSYVRQRFGPRSQVSEAEVDRALASTGQGSARVLLSEIALPLTPELLEQNTELAARLSATINGPAAFAAAARRYSAAPTAPRGGRLDWVPLGNLPPQIVGQVLTLAPGEVSDPVNLGPFVALFMLRELQELEPEAPTTLAVDYAEILIPGGRTPDTLSKAAALRARVDVCDDLYGVLSGDNQQFTRTTRQLGEMPADLALELAKLDAGEMSTLLSTPAALRVIMLCGRSVELPEGAREQVQNSLRQQRLVTYANGALAELRADAVIIATPQ